MQQHAAPIARQCAQRGSVNVHVCVHGPECGCICVGLWWGENGLKSECSTWLELDAAMNK